VSRGTADRTTRLLGTAALLAVAVTGFLALVSTPQDQVQGQLVRLIYIHPASATLTFVACGVTFAASLLYLWPPTRSRRWDLIAASSAEIAAVLCAIALATGSIWGRPTWGVWWTWDARLTLTALLFAMLLGYLALRRIGGPAEARAKLSALAGLLLFAVVPLDHFATEWWRTLHQGDTLFRPKPLIHGSQLVTMVLSFAAFGLVYAWLLVHRYRLEQLEERLEAEGLEMALAERRAEAVGVGPE
jgi:heme exporter protein C